jgi:hypothetical protein
MPPRNFVQWRDATEHGVVHTEDYDDSPEVLPPFGPGNFLPPLLAVYPALLLPVAR